LEVILRKISPAHTTQQSTQRRWCVRHNDCFIVPFMRENGLKGVTTACVSSGCGVHPCGACEWHPYRRVPMLC
jgi:hypothetical protein